MQKPFSEKLVGAKAFVYFLRDYWDGGGSDVAMWWQSRDGKCCHFCATTGETDRSDAKHEIRSNGEIGGADFEKLLDKLIKHGALEMRDDQDTFVFSNSRDVIAVRSADGVENCWGLKTGATHKDPRHLKIFLAIVEAAPSYWPLK